MIATLYSWATIAAVRAVGDDGPNIQSTPSDFGIPGAGTIQTLINWLGQYALWACLAAVLGGAGMYAYGRALGAKDKANQGGALVAGGALGAILVGLAPEIISKLFDITQPH